MRAAQVPQEVAEEWAALSVPDGTHSKSLGRVNKRARTLELSDATCKRGTVARRYELQPPQSQQLSTVVFSRSGEHFGTHALLR